jgi:hypothetical protein
MITSRRRRLWLSHRFLSGLDPDPMIRNLTIEDAGASANLLGNDQAK